MFRKCEYVPTLETDRLILRELEASDADDLQEWFCLKEMYTYWGTPAPREGFQVADLFIDPRPHVKRKPDKGFMWGMVEKETGKVIGIMEIFDVERERVGTVGYRVSPNRWRKGYCSEALQRVIKFAYTETKLDRLWTDVDVNNNASNRVVEKCGFILEGTIRHGKFGSRFCDYNTWGLLREDFEKLEP